MRKFNLKDNVVRRMKGMLKEDDPQPVRAEETKTAAEEKQPAEFGCKTMRLSWRTDVGRIRKNNQDSVIIGNGMAGVADGMGGHNGGEIASAGLRDGLLRETKGREPGAEALEEAVRKANHELWTQQEENEALSGMGTTLTVLWPTEKDMIIGQIGDSRAYLIRGGEMKQMTNDHSMVADMVRKGVLTEEQAACHPMRNYITRAVGTDETVELDIQTVPRAAGDRWLICSDGLHGMVSRGEILKLAMTENLENAVDSLLQAALENGGKDNISLVLLQDEGVFDLPSGNETASGISPETGEGKGEAAE